MKTLESMIQYFRSFIIWDMIAQKISFHKISAYLIQDIHPFLYKPETHISKHLFLTDSHKRTWFKSE